MTVVRADEASSFDAVHLRVGALRLDRHERLQGGGRGVAGVRGVGVRRVVRGEAAGHGGLHLRRPQGAVLRQRVLERGHLLLAPGHVAWRCRRRRPCRAPRRRSSRLSMRSGCFSGRSMFRTYCAASTFASSSAYSTSVEVGDGQQVLAVDVLAVRRHPAHLHEGGDADGHGDHRDDEDGGGDLDGHGAVGEPTGRAAAPRAREHGSHVKPSWVVERGATGMW